MLEEITLLILSFPPVTTCKSVSLSHLKKHSEDAMKLCPIALTVQPVEEEKYNIKVNSGTKIKLEKSLIYSDGNLGDAIHVLESDIITDDNFDDFQIWMRLCYSANIQEIVKWVNERTKKGRRNQSVFLKYSLKMVRNCLIIHFSDPNTLNITENEKKFLSKFHPFIHEGNISEISEKMEESIKNIERNANSKIIFYELSLQLMILLKVNRKFVE